MLRKTLLLCALVIVGACNATGYTMNPWANTAGKGAAAAPPRPLTASDEDNKDTQTGNDPYAHVIENPDGTTSQNGEFDMAGLDYDPGVNNQNPYMQQSPYMRQQQQPMQPALKPVKVALLVPLSGPHKDLGQAFLQSSQMAMFDMNFPAFEIMPRDTAGDPQTAQKAAENAIRNGAELILGPLFATSVRAAKPVARRHNINMIAFSTDWSLAGDNTYIMGFLPFAQVQRVAGYAIDNDYQNIGILAPNTDYGNAVIAAYNSLTYRAGLPRADIARFSGDDNQISEVVKNFTHYDERQAILESITDADGNLIDGAALPPLPFDAILMPAGGDQARSISNLLSYYDLDEKTVKRLGTGLWDDMGLAAEQSMNYAWFAAPSPEQRKDFETRFRQLYGYSAPRLATLPYDATALAIVLARKAHSEGMLENASASYGRSTVYSHNQISNPNGFAGVDGIFRFRPDNLVERGLAVLEISDGEINVIDPAPTTFQKNSKY